MGFCRLFIFTAGSERFRVSIPARELIYGSVRNRTGCSSEASDGNPLLYRYSRTPSSTVNSMVFIGGKQGRLSVHSRCFPCEGCRKITQSNLRHAEVSRGSAAVTLFAIIVLRLREVPLKWGFRENERNRI